MSDIKLADIIGIDGVGVVKSDKHLSRSNLTTSRDITTPCEFTALLETQGLVSVFGLEQQERLGTLYDSNPKEYVSSQKRESILFLPYQRLEPIRTGSYHVSNVDLHDVNSIFEPFFIVALSTDNLVSKFGFSDSQNADFQNMMRELLVNPLREAEVTSSTLYFNEGEKFALVYAHKIDKSSLAMPENVIETGLTKLFAEYNRLIEFHEHLQSVLQ